VRIARPEVVDELKPQLDALDPITARNLRSWLLHPSGDFARAVAEFYPELSEQDRYLLATPISHNLAAGLLLDEAYRLESLRRRSA
jgi:hypothetical protein